MEKFSFEDLNKILIKVPDLYKKKKLSVLMPFYNEQKLIADSVYKVAGLLRSWDWNFEIIASDDGSTDNGVQELNNIKSEIPELIIVSSPRNFGKGRALLSAYEASSGDYVLFLDADLELPAQHIPYFFLRMAETNADVVIGSKQDPRSNLFYPWFRRLMSGIYFFIIKILFHLPVQDTQTGIKLFKREILDISLPYLLVKRFAFDIELLTLCYRQGATIVSAPVLLNFVRENDGRMNLDTILHVVKDTLAVFWRIHTGFWQTYQTGRQDLKYAAVFVGGKAVVYNVDSFFIESLDNLKDMMPQLENYDAIIFLKSNMELPSFAKSSLDRIFVDSRIQAVYPLLYSSVEQGLSFFRYSMLANIFFYAGYYPHYRPVRQNFIVSLLSIPLDKCVVRRTYLEQLLKKYQNIHISEVTVDYSKTVHTPYFFLNVLIPDKNQEWNDLLESEKHLIDSMKKSIHYLLWSLYAAGFFIFLWGFWWGIIPFLAVEFSILGWSVFALGIRRGIPFYGIFCSERIRLFFDLKNNLKIIILRFFKK